MPTPKENAALGSAIAKRLNEGDEQGARNLAAISNMVNKPQPDPEKAQEEAGK